MIKPRVLGIVLAGGEGKRLWPLTADRAKPAVPFGGNYRLIDFVLSNLVNAGYLQICVLTQYKSHSLDRHITTDLADDPAARQLRHAGARAAAARPALVHRQRRRDPAAPEPGLRRAARLHRGFRCRPRLPDGSAADGRPAHRDRRRGDRRRDPGAARRRRRSSASSTPTRTAGCADSWRSRPTRRVPDRPDETFASMGNYVFTTERCSRRCASTPTTSPRCTTWAATSCRCWSTA